MSERFSPLTSLPGWEATAGRFAVCRCGRLRFLRTIRRVGDHLAYPLVTDTPRAFDLLIEDFAAALALADEAA